MNKYLSILVVFSVTTMALGQSANVVTFNIGAVVKQGPQVVLDSSRSLAMNAVGEYALTVISTNTIELFRVTQKPLSPLPYTGQWTFIGTNGTGTLPATSDFVVTTNGVTAIVNAVNFKRRVLYGPLMTRDLRLGNQLYLTLAGGIPTNCVVTVSNVSGTLWTGYNYATTNHPLSTSPVIHANQIGYVTGMKKKAYVGFYLGTGGELTSFRTNTFYLINANGATVYTNGMTQRPDIGYTYTPTPYQKVYELDFSMFNTEGQYRIYVPSLGCSYPFWLGSGVAANYARSYALGVYHQRCGTTNDLPWTRHYHNHCHTNLSYIPTATGLTAMSNSVNTIMAGEGFGHEDQNGGLESISEVLYPYISTARLDTAGGHHDAGDYSKYTTSVAKFCEAMIFAADSLPGVKLLDNLGIPESGDGISDIIQEVKWEADYLVKIFDSDGGAYMLNYPTNGQYQNNLPESPENSQLMMPKSTVATAAAVGALAEIASSPTFKAAYPAAAAAYLTKALQGWTFLTNAFTAHGFANSYQYIMFQGAVFNHTDEVFYASTALYLATTNSYFSNYARTLCPNPFSTDNRRWGLIAAYDGYGYGFRQWAFAVASGRVLASKVDSTYVDSCKNELRKAAADNKLYSDHTAYGSSIFDDWKSQRQGGWYFGSDMAFDSAVVYALDGNASDLEVILKNFNFEMGGNPVNVSYLTGTGYRRQRETVNSYSVFGRPSHNREFPPTGIPLGNYQSGYDCCYDNLPDRLEIDYPKNDDAATPYAYYDRWGDTFNVTTEWVVSQAARSLATAAYVAALAGQTNQEWTAKFSEIVLSTNIIAIGSTGTALLTNSGGVILTDALVLWEVDGEPSTLGNALRTLTPSMGGSHRIEAEASLPDGRRLFARTNFIAAGLVTNNIETYQASNLSNNAAVIAWWKLDTTLTPNNGTISTAVTLAGDAVSDTSSFVWTNRPLAGGAIQIADLGDNITVSVPNSDLKSGTGISIEAMLYIRELKGDGQGHATMFHLDGPGNQELNMYQNSPDTYPTVAGNSQTIANQATVGAAIILNQWQHWKIQLTATGYAVSVDGVTIATLSDADDYTNWSNSGNSTLTVGDFYGWVDEVVVKNVP